MKKYKFKTRMQWNWYRAALYGAVAVILVVPAAGNLSDSTSIRQKLEENPIVSAISSISFGPKVKVMINGEIVALAKSEEEAAEAYKKARLAYNAEGIKILNIDVTYGEVDKEKDGETVKGMRVLRDENLSNAILESFGKYGHENKSLAYTMRIDDYTVTLGSMEELVSVLEQAQGKYDSEDAFQVGLKPPASRNVTMYEVDVVEKNSTVDGETVSGIFQIPERQTVLLTGAEIEGNEDTAGEDTGDEGQAGEDGSTGDEEQADEAGSAGDEQPEGGQPEEGDSEGAPEISEEMAAQAADDGVKYVGFLDTIQVMETYVDTTFIKDRDTVFAEVTQENDEPSIYVVEPGDCLSIIAEKNNMSVEQIKELNPHIESDDDIYYDDRLNITVPTAAVQILVEKQETYEEEYNEDIVYEDDDSMYIGESEVVQEGTPGRHIVTDLVTYKGDLESGREQLAENVQVAAIAEVVRRGTKSKPTYMYPVTNWNITSNFGYRWGRLHAGTDVGVPVGTTVRASRGGQVVTAGWVGGYGNCVIIDHGDGVSTRYGHLSEVSVSVGQYVDQGQQVALSGNTGRSTGPHLHFEIRIGGEAVDPMPYLTQSN
ncbi:MAG: peptidoglycan DD-metalloendopeptidase family protein [Lachnospiraceae bacterium]|nr:peptidoglycan DD-metalloendopeptidase family protein [Lachnospiraceae bacterium]